MQSWLKPMSKTWHNKLLIKMKKPSGKGWLFYNIKFKFTLLKLSDCSFQQIQLVKFQ
jgi:hypothetical protein